MIAFYMGVIIGLKGGAKCCTSVLLFIVLKCKKTYPFYSDINIFCNLAA